MKMLNEQEIITIAGGNAWDTVMGTFVDSSIAVNYADPGFQCVLNTATQVAGWAQTAARAVFGPYGEATGLNDVITASALVAGTGIGIGRCDVFVVDSGAFGGSGGSSSIKQMMLY
jgi:hypothetical protein